MTNGSHGSIASPRAPQPGPQVATDPSPLFLHQRSGPKSGLSISHPQISSKGHQCLRVAAVLTAAMWWDRSGHAGLPSGPRGGKGGRYSGQFTGFTPHAHMAVVGTVPTCKGCCTAWARHFHATGLPCHPCAAGDTKITSSTSPPPRDPSLNLQGKSPLPANAPQVLFPRMLWNRDPPGSH